MQFAKTHIDSADGYEVCDNSDATLKVEGADCKVKFETKRKWVDGLGYVLVAFGDIDGMTIAKYKAFRDNIAANMTAMESGKIKVTNLENTHGADIAVMM